MWVSLAAPGATDFDHRSDRQGPKEGDTYIYFFGTEYGDLEVKLGRSDNPLQRLKQHSQSNGHHEPLRVLAILRGSRSDEKALKRYFASHTSRPRSDEWIHAGFDSAIRTWLRWLMSQPYVVTHEDPAAIAALPVVPSEEWLPAETRTKHFAQLELVVPDERWGDLCTSVVMEGDFYTDPRIMEAARMTMGGIDLDPASCAEANRCVGATEFFGIKENGLLRNWAGRVWLNPPFGKWGDGWATKAVYEWRRGQIEQMCLLASTRAITAQGFLPIKVAADALWIGHGRIPFWGPKASSSPDEGHVVFYFGASLATFIDAFERSGLGTVYPRREATR
jgi:DNA N-6-adenine-methyltransferase (Dam)/T5orf172 domain